MTGWTVGSRSARRWLRKLLVVMAVPALIWSAAGTVHGSDLVPTCTERPGILQIVGFELIVTARDGDANDLRIQLVGGTYTPPGTGQPLTTGIYRVTDPGASFAYVPETGCATDTAATCSQDDDGVTTCSAVVSDFRVDLGDGDDNATAEGMPGGVMFLGGDGNDTLIGGDGGDVLRGGRDGDFIAGGGGNDDIDGGPGWDTLEGGPGEDHVSGGSTDPFATSGNDIIRGGPDRDTLDGGSGSLTDPDHDLLDYSDSTAPITLNLRTGEGPDDVTGFEQIWGGSGDDHLTGGAADALIVGGPGNDTIAGYAGRNELFGGLGDDVLLGYNWSDTMLGGEGDDILIDGWEGISGEVDSLFGGPGNDRLVGGIGDNYLYGEDGDDWLVAGCEDYVFEASHLFGMAGNDTLSEVAEPALDAHCYYHDLTGLDLTRGDSADELDGGAGVDILDLCVPEDPESLAVPAGYRPLAEGSLTTCLRRDTQYVSATKHGHTAYREDVVQEATHTALEDVMGGGSDDFIIGFGGYINGATGRDNLSCGRVIDAGPGGPMDYDDVVSPCPGATYPTIVDYSRRTEPVTVKLDGFANDGGWNDELQVGEDDNVLVSGGVLGGEGDDVLIGDDFDNSLPGGGGDDRIEGRGGTDALSGGDGDDDIDGGAGNDALSGDAGDDDLKGGAGNDAILGGDGADTVDGGSDTDALNGGPGADVILARDGTADLVDCGGDTDSARLDRLDLPSGCETAITGVTEAVSPGDVVTTDVEGDGATAQHAIEVTITAASAGTVEATERPISGPNPSGYVLLGIRYDIRLPAGTASAPNVLTFRIDASLVPPGQDEQDIAIYRNGALVPPCDPSPPRAATTAAPDPCVASRRLLADGDVEIIVLTSHASDWDFAVDIEAPTITIATPLDGAAYLLRESVAADYACRDDGSGLASCAGSAPDGAGLDTATIGDKSFTVIASDRVGNRSEATVSYRVIYDFSGFFSPLENPGHVAGLLNVVKAGSTLPVRFSLHGDQGLGVLAAGSPASTPVTCDTHAPTDQVEEVATSGSTTLAYDPATDTYRVNWKSDKAWAGTCRALDVRLADGTDHLVLFRFTK